MFRSSFFTFNPSIFSPGRLEHTNTISLTSQRVLLARILWCNSDCWHLPNKTAVMYVPLISNGSEYITRATIFTFTWMSESNDFNVYSFSVLFLRICNFHSGGGYSLSEYLDGKWERGCIFLLITMVFLVSKCIHSIHFFLLFQKLSMSCARWRSTCTTTAIRCRSNRCPQVI